jgi:hypothetical protein
MDDSFAFRTTAPPLRRRIDRRLVKAGIGAGVVLLVVGWFASWVIASERRSFSDLPPAVIPSQEAGAEAAQDPATRQDADEALRIAFATARAASIDGRTFVDAGPARLTELQPSYSYVDGPSTMPRIVSVATSHEVWAAAVMAPDGTCLWIRATLAGEVTRLAGDVTGIAGECTGSAALRSDGRR